MHRSLYVYDILILIFKFAVQWSHREGLAVDKKMLAVLARTCQLFNSPALDLLWHDLDSFDPLIKIFPIYPVPASDPGASRMSLHLENFSAATTSISYFFDKSRWLTFHKYAMRIKTFTLRGNLAIIPVEEKQEFFASLQHYPEVHLPLLPNVVELEWTELSFATFQESTILPLKYFAGPSVTAFTLSLAGWRYRSLAELAVLTDLPKFCPNVTSFTIVPNASWDYEPFREVGRMVARWPMLHTLRTCSILQSVMDQLFSRRTLRSLYIDYHESLLVYEGRIPGSVCDITLCADNLSCRRFLETVCASPTSFRLIIKMNDELDQADTEMLHLLPYSLDAFCLLSLVIRPAPSYTASFQWRALKLRELLLSSVIQFGALHELDLDSFCAAKVSNADYEYLARSLTNLRSFKVGTTNPFVSSRTPVASVRSVIALLRYCQHLETLHIAFDGWISPPGSLGVQKGEVGPSGKLVPEGWGTSNRRITKLCVGYSPMGVRNIGTIARCLKSIMPRLVQIECKSHEEEWGLVQWGLVQDALRSC